MDDGKMKAMDEHGVYLPEFFPGEPNFFKRKRERVLPREGGYFVHVTSRMRG